MKLFRGKHKQVSPEEVLVSCVAENREPYKTEACYLFQSLSVLGGNLSRSKKIAYFVESADSAVVERLRNLGVIVKIVDRIDRRCPHANKLRMLEDDEDYCVLVALDCDVAIARDFLPSLDAETVKAKPADDDPLDIGKWKGLFAHFGLKLPNERYKTAFQAKETVSYFNSGVVFIPRKFVPVLHGAWKRFVLDLLGSYEQLPDIGHQSLFTDQFAFALALCQVRVPFEPLSLEFNFPTHNPVHRAFKPERLNPYIIHYHHRLLEEGIESCADESINKSIEKINSALAGPVPVFTGTKSFWIEKAFDNRLFWNEGYTGHRELGSGIGSRGQFLLDKKSILEKLVNENLPETVLDVGCGDLEVTGSLAFNKYLGIDISEVIIERNRRKWPELAFVAGDFLELAKGDELNSDIVICLDVVIHESDMERYKRIVETLVTATKRIGVIAAYEMPPRKEFRSETTFYHEPITETLRRAGARDIRAIGYYRDLSVISYRTKDSSRTSFVLGKSKAVCILGMHRSGTSAIARGVNLLGAYLGEQGDLVPPGPDNLAGYWERHDTVTVNDEIESFYKKSWYTALPMAAGWERSEEIKPLRERVKALIKENFSGQELWAWKDPRTTLVFEIWRDVLEEFGVDLVCLFAVRNPLDVAKSHEKRDRFPKDKTYGIWFNYNLAALRSTVGLRRAFLSYDRYLSDWEGELKRCARELDITWPADDAKLRAEMDQFVSQALRHSYSGMNELEESGAPRPVVELYELLDGVSSGRIAADASFNSRIESLAGEFSDYFPFFKAEMERLWELERMVPALETKLAERDQRIDTLLHSWSWKISAPLRKAASMLKGSD